MLRIRPDPSPIAAVLVHVPNVETGLAWYAAAFPQAARRTLEDGYELLELHGLSVEVVPTDSKVSSGAAGSVVYWSVEVFDSALSHLQDLGASLYRGPMNIENGLRMCQVRDPWGNCIGIRGK